MNLLKRIFDSSGKDSEIEDLMRKVIDNLEQNQSDFFNDITTGRRLTFNTLKKYESEITDGLSIINQAIKLKPRYGEPYIIRADLYLRQSFFKQRYPDVGFFLTLDREAWKVFKEKALMDYKSAIRLGPKSKSAEIREFWEESLQSLSDYS